MSVERLGRPIPIFIPMLEGLVKRFGDGNGLEEQRLGGAHVAGTGEALAGKGQVVAFPDGVHIHLLHRDAALHHGHRSQQVGQLLQLIAHEGTWQTLVASQRGEL